MIMTDSAVIQAEHLEKRFGDLVAVDDVSFHVDAGEIFGLLGPNGAGKSTAMMMLAGLLPVDGGTIAVCGKTVKMGDRFARRALGVVPQELAIYPELTARENLTFFGRLYGVTGATLTERIGEALERTGLTGRADDLAGNYSGGMKRRLNFGIALLHKPKLLILDEPTVGVDPQSRAHLLNCVRDLSDDGVACIYVSHYMEEVQAICRRVAIVDRGKLIVCDTLDSLLGQLTADVCLHVSSPPTDLLESLDGLAELAPHTNGEGEATLIIPRDQRDEEGELSATLTKVVGLLDAKGVTLHAVETHQPNLERLFLRLTGKRLRD